MKINFGLFSKKDLDKAETYLLENDVSELVEEYGNEYLEEILELHYKENVSIRRISENVPYSFSRISFFILDFKKFILYKTR